MLSPRKVGANIFVARGCGKMRKRFPRRARERVKHVGVAAVGLAHVVEERAELGVREFGGGVGHLLDDRFAIKGRRDKRANLAQLLRVGRVFAGLLQQPRALGDVARDLRGADNRACFIADRRNGKGNGAGCAVFPEADGLVVIHLLPAADLGHHLVFLVLKIRGNEDADRLADRFLGGVTEDFLGARIPRSDDAVEVLADDGVIGRFDDLGKVPRGEIVEVGQSKPEYLIDENGKLSRSQISSYG